MKKFSSFLITLGALTCSTLTFANSVTVHNYYINGMNTVLKDARDQRDAINEHLTNEFGTSLDTPVELLHNQSDGQLDYLEVQSQHMNQITNFFDESSDFTGKSELRQRIELYLEDRKDAAKEELILKTAREYYSSNSTNRANILAGVSKTGTICNTSRNVGSLLQCAYNFDGFNINFDFITGFLKESEVDSLKDDIETIENILLFSDIITAIRLQVHKNEFEDTTNMLSTFTTILENPDNRVNVLSYSQGNFFANQVFKTIDDKQRTRLLSVGTPASYQYNGYNDPNMDTNTRNRYVKLKEDIFMAGVPDSMPANFSNYIFSDNILNLVNGLGPNQDAQFSPVTMISANTQYFSDLLGHGILDTYLKGTVSKYAIMNIFKYNHDSLKPLEVAGTEPLPELPTLPDLNELEPSQVNNESRTENIFLKNQSLSANVVFAGDTITASVQQWHEGEKHQDDIGTMYVGYYISEDTVLDGSDLQLSEDSSGIGINDSYDGEADSIVIQDWLAPGDYHILFVADNRYTLSETLESDNVVSLPIRVNSFVENDVYVQSASVSNITETSIYATARQYYQGDLTSSELGSIYMGYYISDDRYLSSDDTRLATDPSSIGSNDSYDSESATLSLPSNLQNGQSYYILFVGDYDNKVSETNEDNNLDYEEFTYTSSTGSDNSQGDVYIKNASVNENSDGTYTVSLSQYYSGNVTNSILANPDVAYVFSQDRTVQSSQDTLLGTDSSTIGSDDTYDNESLTFSIPSHITSSGYYYVIVVVDSRAEVSESNENNNVAYLRFYVNR